MNAINNHFSAGHFKLVIDGKPVTAYIKGVEGGLISAQSVEEPVGIASWGKVFNDDPMIAGAMLDRLLHRSIVLNITGDSYRMRSHRARAEATRRAVAAT